MSSRLQVLASLVLAALGSACSAVTIDDAQFYHLPVVALDAATSPLPLVVRVSNFTVAPHLDGVRVLTHEASTRVRARADERWSAPLSALVANSIREGLLEARRFRGVVDDRDNARADLVLDGRVLDFEEFVDGSGRKASVTLALALRDESRGELLMQRRVASKLPLEGADGPSLVHALHRALGVAFRSFLAMAEERASAWAAPKR